MDLVTWQEKRPRESTSVQKGLNARLNKLSSFKRKICIDSERTALAYFRCRKAMSRFEGSLKETS